jgi:CubicO group peptidase (beta-lactamase class C family)
MQDSHFTVPVGKLDRLLPIFEIDGDARLRPVGPGTQRGGPYEFSSSYPAFAESRYFSGGGGIVASARDVGTFIAMLAAGGVHDGQRLVSRNLFDEFRKDQTKPFGTGIDGVGFGLGIGVRLAADARGTRGPVGELFWSGIFFTTLWVDADRGVAGTFLTQMRPDQRGDTARRVQNAVFDALYPAGGPTCRLLP